MQKTIYTSYFGNYRNIPSEYQCISIANSKPRIGVPTWTDVVPDWKDVEAFKQNRMSELEFTMRYMHKLDRKPARHYFDYLNEFEADTIVLLCYEKQYFNCHRMLLGYWLHNNLHVNIDEYPSEYYVPKEQQRFTCSLELIKELNEAERQRLNFWM